MRKRNELVPLWPSTFAIPERPPLAEDLIVDVCVVGAGIAGLTTAYKLALAGVKTAVLDAGRIGGGETERTTAHLAVALDSGYADLLRVHGEEAVRLAAGSHAAAIDEIERIVDREGIDCGFERVDGWLFAGPGGSSSDLADELAASRKAGIDGAEAFPRAPLSAFITGAAIRYPRQAQFHPLRYLAALALAAERLGARIFCETRVVDAAGGEPARVETERGRVVTASAVVLATNTPFNDRFTIHTKQASYRTYVVAAPLSGSSFPRALYWDTESPYHYARVNPGRDGEPDVLIVGGEDHKTGQPDGAPEARFDRLESWSRARFPGMGEVERRWSGQVIGTSDGMAFIGRNPGDEPNVFIVTGDCGHGMTHGTIAGLMLPSLISGRPHLWEKLYDPARARPASVARWARENLNAAAQYAGHFSPGDISSVDEIEPGEGAVIRRGLSKVAVYRAPDGSLNELSAVCPHLGAVVRWNSAEKTWDCPAHGSRFEPGGGVVNGPAASGLSPAKTSAGKRRRKRLVAARRSRSKRKGAAPPRI